MDIKPIETCYNGYRFRSRLEARWAVFMDALGIKYEYEPEGYELPSGWYLPDFWLPEWKTWLEVKPEGGMTPRAESLAKELCEGTRYAVLVTNGLCHQGTCFCFGLGCVGLKEIQFTILRMLEQLECLLQETDNEEPGLNLKSFRDSIALTAKNNYFSKHTPKVTKHSFVFSRDANSGNCTIRLAERYGFLDRSRYIVFQNIKDEYALYDYHDDDDGCSTMGLPLYDRLHPIERIYSSPFNPSAIYYENSLDKVDYAIADALQKAKSARFEHGEAPQKNFVARRAIEVPFNPKYYKYI